MKKIRINSRVIITKENKILLIRNKGKNYWYLPGGGLEDNETIIDCGKREAMEELGVKVDVKNLLYIQELHDKDRQYFEFFWIAELQKDETINLEHKDTDENSPLEEIRWFEKSELKNITVYPEVFANLFWEQKDKRNTTFLGVFK